MASIHFWLVTGPCAPVAGKPNENGGPRGKQLRDAAGVLSLAECRTVASYRGHFANCVRSNRHVVHATESNDTPSWAVHRGRWQQSAPHERVTRKELCMSLRAL